MRPRAPALTIDKTITDGDPYTAAGRRSTTATRVTNTGNVTISALAVTDDNDRRRAGLPGHDPRVWGLDDLHGEPTP